MKVINLNNIIIGNMMEMVSAFLFIKVIIVLQIREIYSWDTLLFEIKMYTTRKTFFLMLSDNKSMTIGRI